MSDLDRLLEAFESGALLRPDAADPNFIDLVRAVAALAGVDHLERSPNSEAMSAMIGQPEHLVFVLADGLGTHFIEDAGVLHGHVPPGERDHAATCVDVGLVERGLF